MKLTDFDFELPERLIATRPAVPRSASRLLVAQAGQIEDAYCTDLPKWLRCGDRLVLNDTKVIPARLQGWRHRQGADGLTRAAMDLAERVMDMQGVVSPIYLLNGIASIIGRKGEGLIGFSFNLKGKSDKPRILVNPLSALTPGMFREIFRRPAPKLKN